MKEFFSLSNIFNYNFTFHSKHLKTIIKRKNVLEKGDQNFKVKFDNFLPCALGLRLKITI